MAADFGRFHVKAVWSRGRIQYVQPAIASHEFNPDLPGAFRLTHRRIFRVCGAMPKRIPLRAMIRSLILLLGAACLVAGCQSFPQPTAVRTFRVMTYNIHHGEGLDGKVDLLRIAELIKREGADLVTLQEVDKGVERTAHRDFPDELAALTGLTCVFSNNYHYQGGEYGNAVLTRFPVKRWINTHFKKVNETEQRGILRRLLDVRGREIVFMATHIDHRPDDAARWSNVGEIEKIIKSKRLNRPPDPLSMNLKVGRLTPCAPFRLCPNPGAHGVTRPTCTNWFRGSTREMFFPGILSPADGKRAGVGGRPIILCGDFNDTPESRVCRRLNQTFDDSWALAGQGDGFTIPAEKPRKRIDYIWISKDKSLEPLKVWVPQSDASDHRPVVSEFRFR